MFANGFGKRPDSEAWCAWNDGELLWMMMMTMLLTLLFAPQNPSASHHRGIVCAKWPVGNGQESLGASCMTHSGSDTAYQRHAPVEIKGHTLTPWPTPAARNPLMCSRMMCKCSGQGFYSSEAWWVLMSLDSQEALLLLQGMSLSSHLAPLLLL